MGEEGEDTLGKIFTERFGSRSGWRLRSPTAVIFWRELEKRKKNRGRRKRRLNRYRWQGASEGGALRAYVVQRPLPAGSLRRHYLWRPSMHLGCQDGWRPVIEFRYEKCFVRLYLCKKFLKRTKIKKNYPIVTCLVVLGHPVVFCLNAEDIYFTVKHMKSIVCYAT
jgi:hypothetical protein